MEEERKEVQEPVQEEPKKEGASITLPVSLLNLLGSCFAIFLFMILKIILYFGGGSAVLNGIFMILIYGSAAFGLVFNYIKAKGKANLDFWLSLIALVLILMQ